MPPLGLGDAQAAPCPVSDSHPVATAQRIAAGSAWQAAGMAWHSIQSGSFDFIFTCACDFGLHACPQKSARPKLMDVAMSIHVAHPYRVAATIVLSD